MSASLIPAPTVRSVRRKPTKAKTVKKAAPAATKPPTPTPDLPIVDAFRVFTTGTTHVPLRNYADSPEEVKAELSWQKILERNGASAIQVEPVKLLFPGTRFAAVWIEFNSRRYVPEHPLDFYFPTDTREEMYNVRGGETTIDTREAWDSLTREQVLSECVRLNSKALERFAKWSLKYPGHHDCIEWLVAIEIGEDIEQGFLGYQLRGKYGKIDSHRPRPIRLMQPTATELWKHGFGPEPAVKDQPSRLFEGSSEQPKRFAVIDATDNKVVGRMKRDCEAKAFADEFKHLTSHEIRIVPEQITWPTDAQVLASLSVKGGVS